MPKEEEKRLVCRISGAVQGVGFRWSVRELAQRLKLSGYVRNLADGRVELVVEGATPSLEAARAFCYRGPDGARVAQVEVTEESATGEFGRFTVR